MGVYKKLDQVERELARVKLDLSLSKEQIEDMRKSAQKVEKERRDKIRNLEIVLKAADDACNKLRDERDNLAARLTTAQIKIAELQDYLESTNKELAQKASNKGSHKRRL